MAMVSARDFNHAPSKVKSMAKHGPVFVTDRGAPSIVVLDIEEYERLTGGGSVLDSLRTELNIEFEPVVRKDLGVVPEL